MRDRGICDYSYVYFLTPIVFLYSKHATSKSSVNTSCQHKNRDNGDWGIARHARINRG